MNPFDFATATSPQQPGVLSRIGSIAKKLVQPVISAGRAIENPFDFATKKAVDAIAVPLAQGVARSGGSIAADVLGSGTFTPTGKVEKAVYGTEPVVPFQQAVGQAVASGQGFARRFGGGSKSQKTLGALAGAGFAGLEAANFAGGEEASAAKKGLGTATKALKEAKAFEGFTDLTTRVLEALKGKTTVSRQFIEDLTNSPDLKQAERDLIRSKLSEVSGDKIDVPRFAEEVKAELLPLKRNENPQNIDHAFRFNRPTSGQYEHVTLPDELRGPVQNYSEHIYESPVKTSAGQVHFGGLRAGGAPEGYFGHTRVEDLPGSTRRVIETQSDLYQRGRLSEEAKKLLPDNVHEELKSKFPEIDEKTIRDYIENCL